MVLKAGQLIFDAWTRWERKKWVLVLALQSETAGLRTEMVWGKEFKTFNASSVKGSRIASVDLPPKGRAGGRLEFDNGVSVDFSGFLTGGEKT